MTTTNATGEDIIHPYPNLLVPELTSHLLTPSLANIRTSSYTRLIDLIKKDHMAPFYRSLFSSSPASTFSLSSLTLSPLSPSSPKLGRKELEGGPLGRMGESLVQELEAENEKVLSEYQKKIEEAEKVEGESEIAEAWREKAMYLTRIGEKEQAIAAQRTAFEKTAGVGSRIDISLTLVRIGFFFGIIELQKEFLTKAEELIEKGGDWDRRNRLKVYTAYHTLATSRNFTSAAQLLIDALPTFTATELLPLGSFIQLTLLLATFSQERTSLRTVLKSAEVASFYVAGSVRDLPDTEVGDLANALVASEYAEFFRALAVVEEKALASSRLMSRHKRFFVRELKVKAYRQLLESYRSLTIDSMAQAFGVSAEFVDNDLLRFISTGRLNCVVDRVHGIVETNRPSTKSARFEAVVKQGDILLNDIQRLSKVLY